MSINKYQDHVLVLPEDDANVALANGFMQELAGEKLNRIQILRVCGGWSLVIENFCTFYADSMRTYDGRFMVLLLDLDGHLDRIEKIRARVPEDLQGRVFVLSVRTEPEDLRKSNGEHLELWGRRMAKDCNLHDGAWSHDLLSHNALEIARMRSAGVIELLLD